MTTGIVAVEVAATKFFHGAWIVIVLIPILIGIMLFIRRQYASSAEQLQVPKGVLCSAHTARSGSSSRCPGSTGRWFRRSTSADPLHPTSWRCWSPTTRISAARIREEWEVQLPDVPLVIVESPYRALVGPLIAYLDVLDETWPADREEPITFVVIPEFVARHWWEQILYNQSANRLRRALLGRKHTVVVNVPYRREHEPDEAAEGSPA